MTLTLLKTFKRKDLTRFDTTEIKQTARIAQTHRSVVRSIQSALRWLRPAEPMHNMITMNTIPPHRVYRLGMKAHLQPYDVHALADMLRHGQNTGTAAIVPHTRAPLSTRNQSAIMKKARHTGWSRGLGRQAENTLERGYGQIRYLPSHAEMVDVVKDVIKNTHGAKQWPAPEIKIYQAEETILITFKLKSRFRGLTHCLTSQIHCSSSPSEIYALVTKERTINRYDKDFYRNMHPQISFEITTRALQSMNIRVLDPLSPQVRPDILLQGIDRVLQSLLFVYDFPRIKVLLTAPPRSSMTVRDLARYLEIIPAEHIHPGTRIGDMTSEVVVKSVREPIRIRYRIIWTFLTPGRNGPLNKKEQMKFWNAMKLISNRGNHPALVHAVRVKLGQGPTPLAVRTGRVVKKKSPTAKNSV